MNPKVSFFVMEAPEEMRESRTDYFNEEPVNLGPAPTCPVCDRWTGLKTWLPPYRAEIEVWGKSWCDIGFGVGNAILVSDRFRQWYSGFELAGIKSFHSAEIVKIRRRHGVKGEPPEYFLATVGTGRAAIDQAASGLERKDGHRDKLPICPECRLGGIIHRIRRLVIEPNTWSGEDLFIARGLPVHFVVSERFRNLSLQSRIVGAAFVNGEDYQFDHYPGEGRLA